MNIAKLHSNFIDIVASELHYFEEVEKLTDSSKSNEVEYIIDGWKDKYRTDSNFRLKVQRIVVQLTQEVIKQNE